MTTCVRCGAEIKKPEEIADHFHGEDTALTDATLIVDAPGWSGRVVGIAEDGPGAAAPKEVTK